ncbi:hypothetical protein PHYPSEUDO_002999 [Phytophthora pseudosyringae]|uniref:Uncharacterized protein n=1 Tax=Phytophthora pseudosyringae TaxID=221518 RepID=A0A8T1VWZ1_9STRA|nr:hypothetical protein PHYPSEUDO_002999 [Phytophthora pseudosyringae]
MVMEACKEPSALSSEPPGHRLTARAPPPRVWRGPADSAQTPRDTAWRHPLEQFNGATPRRDCCEVEGTKSAAAAAYLLSNASIMAATFNLGSALAMATFDTHCRAAPAATATASSEPLLAGIESGEQTQQARYSSWIASSSTEEVHHDARLPHTPRTTRALKTVWMEVACARWGSLPRTPETRAARRLGACMRLRLFSRPGLGNSVTGQCKEWTPKRHPIFGNSRRFWPDVLVDGGLSSRRLGSSTRTVTTFHHFRLARQNCQKAQTHCGPCQLRLRELPLRRWYERSGPAWCAMHDPISRSDTPVASKKPATQRETSAAQSSLMKS